MSSPLRIFFLGATGFIGSQLIVDLARRLPHLPIIAQVRAATAEKEGQLKSIHPNISIVLGSLDDGDIMQEQTSQADIVINAADSDHLPSTEAILAGLEKRSASHPGNPPIYLHISGLAVTSDNCWGEYIEPANIPEYSDIGLNLNQCPPQNAHLLLDKKIMAAGTRKENPIRTVIIFPGWVYGIGEGIQKVTSPVRVFLSMAKTLGTVSVIGPGLNRISNIHVKDVSSACLAILEAGLVGKADEGAEGLYFAVTMEPKVTMYDYFAKLGQILCAKGIIKTASVNSLPREVVEPMGRAYGGGNMYAKPDRLTRLGWVPTETPKLSLLESLPVELEEALKDQHHVEPTHASVDN